MAQQRGPEDPRISMLGGTIRVTERAKPLPARQCRTSRPPRGMCVRVGRGLLGTPASVQNWIGIGRAYRASFARLCAGTIDEVLGELAGERLLDVGCGTGDLLAKAIDRGWAVEGVDPDPDMVTMSEALAPRRVRRAALPELPFEDGTFDAVTANFVVNHVADPRAAV